MYDLMEGEMTQVKRKFLENYKSDRYLFRVFNSKRVGDCAANGILRDLDEFPFAVSCNCGRKTYHPVINNGTSVAWDKEFTIKSTNKNLVQRIVKDLWIKQF